MDCNQSIECKDICQKTGCQLSVIEFCDRAQALAANRFGSEVILVSRIGTDIFSEIAMKLLKQSSLNIDHVRKSGTNTAIGLVQSSRQGETQVLVAAGALKYFKHSDIDDSLYKKSGIVLCQTELAFDEVEKVVEKAKRNDCQVILNLSSSEACRRQFLKKVSYLVVNEIEAEMLSHSLNIARGGSLQELAKNIYDDLRVSTVVTAGDRGSFLCSHEGLFYIPTNPVEAVDPTGSGDAFCGTFASGIDLGLDPMEALRLASAAGALTCLGLGVQSSLPNRDQIFEYSKTINSGMRLGAELAVRCRK